MEIGSIVSPKVLPIFKDSHTVFNYLEYSRDKNNVTNHFILVPNEDQFNNIEIFKDLKHFCFITSVSESFQRKNTKMSLDKTFYHLNNMMYRLDDNRKKSFVKIYVSCINECPIEGKIDNVQIVNKLQEYKKLKADMLCLSDTCGTLNEEDLEYILENISSDNDNKLALHLHVKPGRENEVEKLIWKALEYGITDFDVSALDSGGCSVTMDKGKLSPNLSYDLYYKSICDYIINKSQI